MIDIYFFIGFMSWFLLAMSYLKEDVDDDFIASLIPAFILYILLWPILLTVLAIELIRSDQ